MISHFDAHGLGDPITRRKTRIENMADAEQVRSRIGEQNFAATRRALADGAAVWVFLSEDEIQADLDLRPEEKEACIKIFREEKLGWAGWYRTPRRQTRDPMPGWEPVVGFDSHGNRRGGSSTGGGNWSH